jgi:hypothetical protein
VHSAVGRTILNRFFQLRRSLRKREEGEPVSKSSGKQPSGIQTASHHHEIRDIKLLTPGHADPALGQDFTPHPRHIVRKPGKA